MGKCKTKAIQIDLGIIRHNQAYAGIILAFSEPCLTPACLELWYMQNPEFIFRKHIQNPGIFTTLVYSEPRYLHNAGIFKIRGIFRTLPNVYDESFCENS